MLLRCLEFEPHLGPGHPGGISLCGIKPRTKIEILGWGSCPSRSEPTSPDNPFLENHFRETRRRDNSFSRDTTIALSHNEHNSGNCVKNHPTRKRQDTRVRTRVRLVSHQSSPCQIWQMVARQLKLREGLIKPGLWRMQT